MLVVCPECVSSYRFDRVPGGGSGTHHCAHCRRPLERAHADLPAETAPPRDSSAMPGVLIGLAVLTIASAALVWRGPLVKAYPAVADLPRLVGIGSAANAPSVSGVTSRWDKDGLTVTGTVTNPGDHSLTLPRLRVAVRDGASHTLYSWTATAPQPTLDPGRAISFTSRLDKPPQQGHDLAVGFETDGVPGSDAATTEVR